MDYVLSAEKAATLKKDEPWGSLQWTANSDIGNTENITLGRVIIKKGEANPRHKHSNCEEVLYLLSGSLDHTVGDDHVTLKAGDTLTLPPDIYHNATNIGEEDADMIVAYSTGKRDFQLENPSTD